MAEGVRCNLPAAVTRLPLSATVREPFKKSHFHGCEFFVSSFKEEKKPYRDEHGHHERQGEFKHISQKSRSMHLLMIRDGFDHEIWPVADIGICSKENRADAYGEHPHWMQYGKGMNVPGARSTEQCADETQVGWSVVQNTRQESAAKIERCWRGSALAGRCSRPASPAPASFSQKCLQTGSPLP